MFPLDEDGSDVESVWGHLEHFAPHYLPSGDDGSGDVFALDFTTAPPRVVLFDHEDGFSSVEVAGSFADLLDALIDSDWGE